MNFLKRCFISIKRRKGKSIIMFLAVVLICNVIAGSISVKNAMENTKKSIASSMLIELKPEIDYDKVISVEPDPLTEDIINEIGKSNYLKDYYYSYNYSLTSDVLEGVDGDIILYRELNSKLAYDSETYFSIVGTSSNKIKEISNGKIKIIEGEVYTTSDIEQKNNVVIISSELAEKNNLAVGSAITLRKKIEDYSTFTAVTLKVVSTEYKVVGIFESESNQIKDEEGNIINETNPLANTIYMPSSSLKTIHDTYITELNNLNIEYYDELSISTTYYLNSIYDLENFNNENLKKLPSGYKFTDNSELYISSLSPMNNMGVIADYVMYASIIASILIIGLISLLFFRERKHEMGIYLALGEHKIKIALLILVETLIISVLAVTLSIFTGNIVASNISNKMLENEIANNDSEVYYDEYGYEIDYEAELLEKYNVSLDVPTIILIFLISIGSVTISTLIPIYYTLKLNPRKILM